MYKQHQSGTILRIKDGAFIPQDEGNIDYAEYLAWVAAGNTPLQAQSLAELKADKLNELVDKRKAAILSDVTVAGKVYPTDAEYREIISNLSIRAAAGKPLPATIRGRDGTPVALTPAMIEAIEDAITAKIQAAWDKFWSLYDVVMAATTVEQVNAVMW